MITLGFTNGGAVPLLYCCCALLSKVIIIIKVSQIFKFGSADARERNLILERRKHAVRESQRDSRRHEYSTVTHLWGHIVTNRGSVIVTQEPSPHHCS